MNLEVKVKVIYDWRSINQYVLVSCPICDSSPDIYCSLTVTVLLLWGALSDERTDLSFYMLLALASVVFLGSESLGIRDHILLSRIWNFPFRRLLRSLHVSFYRLGRIHGNSFLTKALSWKRAYWKFHHWVTKILSSTELGACLPINVVFWLHSLMLWASLSHYITIQFVPHRKHKFSATKPTRLMLLREK
jgi:hypothetical protein